MNEFEGNLNTEDIRIGIIISKFNVPITGNLLKGVLAAFENNGLKEGNIDIFYVPGAFEIPVILKTLCLKNRRMKKYDGFITLGCVIKGETAHFEYICENVSRNINDISCEFEIPVGFCVLTCYTAQQAFERSLIPPDAENNKGYEAALSVIEMINLMKKI
ncbi:MAG: 6,7-dimethyl-8-ribityllumazine synthase [Bacteroidetes bacterium]|nr:6,7-dimethyl-8-ribityllumazine synthase [Bacteroidota bacterium]